MAPRKPAKKVVKKRSSFKSGEKSASPDVEKYNSSRNLRTYMQNLHAKDESSPHQISRNALNLIKASSHLSHKYDSGSKMKAGDELTCSKLMLRQSMEIAKYCGRKTVKDRDVMALIKILDPPNTEFLCGDSDDKDSNVSAANIKHVISSMKSSLDPDESLRSSNEAKTYLLNLHHKGKMSDVRHTIYLAALITQGVGGRKTISQEDIELVLALPDMK